MVPFLLEQGLWKPLLLSYDGIISYIQAHFSCWEGRWLSRILDSFLFCVEAKGKLVMRFRFNPSLRHWRLCHVKRCITDHMQLQSRYNLLSRKFESTLCLLRFKPTWAKKWLSMCAGKCGRRPVCHLPGEDAHPNSSSLQTHVLRRLRFGVVRCLCI